MARMAYSVALFACDSERSSPFSSEISFGLSLSVVLSLV